jgi:hypothetical protein
MPPEIESPPTPFRILILGGYGLFGGRIVSALSADADLCLIVAGRDLASAQRMCANIASPQAELQAFAIDAQAADFPQRLAVLAPDLVIDTAGPFQTRTGSNAYRIADAALAAGAHYIDLADGRDFVRDFSALDVTAKTASRWAISGASSVPGLTAAVVEAYRDLFARLDSVESAIAPGNRTRRGWATTLSILGYAGKPFRVLRDGHWRRAYGWQSMRRLRVKGVGVRWLVRCEVPDLDVLPARYPTLRTVDFRAGLELRRMHFGLWLATWLVRTRLMRDLRAWAKPLFRMSQWWQNIGSDVGFIRVTLRGLGHDGTHKRLDWTLIARNGDGPQIPATASVLLARKLARGALPGAGARSCLDLFSLDEFLRTLEGYAMEADLEESPNT